jgi:hypothetical protein
VDEHRLAHMTVTDKRRSSTDDRGVAMTRREQSPACVLCGCTSEERRPKSVRGCDLCQREPPPGYLAQDDGKVSHEDDARRLASAAEYLARLKEGKET